jgi:hypothetical protein
MKTTISHRNQIITITTDHSSSSYGQPVVCVNGVLTDRTVAEIGASVLASVSSYLSNRMTDLNLAAATAYADENDYRRQTAAIDAARDIVEAIEARLDPANVMDIAY